MSERNGQMFLFSDDPERCFETFAGVDGEFLRTIDRLGLLSFAWDEPGVTEERLLEVLFLKTVLRSGFPFDKVMAMLAQLEKPYRYDLSRMTWDLSADRWRVVGAEGAPAGGAAPPTDLEGVLAVIEDYATLGDRDALEAIRRAAARHLGE